MTGKIKYSFKKIIKNDCDASGSLQSFIFLLAFSVLLFVILIIIIVNNEFNFNSIIDIIFEGNLYRLFLFIPALLLLALVFLGLLLKRLHYLKHFLDNCSEVTAKIDEYTSEAELFGKGTGFIVSFSFTYKNKDYIVHYRLSPELRYRSYLDKYSKIGETVQILVRKDNPVKMLIKEVYK